jgi:hypothetical protein
MWRDANPNDSFAAHAPTPSRRDVNIDPMEQIAQKVMFLGKGNVAR